jgi:gamma-glutamylcyclotransferase
MTATSSSADDRSTPRQYEESTAKERDGTDVALYFAYGSNMATEVMASKCSDISVLGPARLAGYRLAFSRRSIRTGTGVANVLSEAGSSVWGVLYEVSDRCLESLDRKEGYPWAYDRRAIDVTLESGERLRALTYVVDQPEPDEVKPSSDYANGLVAAAEEQGLPAGYVDSLRALVPTQP